MRKVFLLTGFQNWGKTWLINELFSRERFYKKALYSFGGQQFCVMPQSNDDLGSDGYERVYHEKMTALTAAGHSVSYIFSAFCPTKEEWNQSDQILKNLYSNDELILIPIEHKWCGHAQLQINEIKQFYSSFKNLSIHPLSQSKPTLKLHELQHVVQSCLP